MTQGQRLTFQIKILEFILLDGLEEAQILIKQLKKFIQNQIKKTQNGEIKKKDKNWKHKKIKARFICALSICYLDKKIASVLGKVEGYISVTPKGKNGFGYDPIFIPKNRRKTFGEMSSMQKYRIDHRFNAFKKIRKFL